MSNRPQNFAANSLVSQPIDPKFQQFSPPATSLRKKPNMSATEHGEKAELKTEKKQNEVQGQIASCDDDNRELASAISEPGEQQAEATMALEIKRARTDNNNDILCTDTLIKEVLEEVDQLNISDERPAIKARSAPPPSSAVVINKESNSLKNLLVYDSGDDSSAEDEDGAAAKSPSDSSSEDSESDSEVLSNCSLSDYDSDIEVVENRGAIKKTDVPKKPLAKCPGEMTLDELPPVPDPVKLCSMVQATDFVHIGHIFTIVETIVTIQALQGMPAYDLDTMLFFGDSKQPLGQVFDVMGPVTSPYYAVRFNSAADIARLKLEKGTKVYSAPKSELTQYVFVKELLKMKGTDASWIGDIEVPEELEDYSDDDCEFYSRTGHERFKPHTKRPHNSLERHQRFERTMNHCNTINTRVSRLRDARHLLRVKKSDGTAQSKIAANPPTVALPAVFDPRVPPPGFPVNGVGGYATQPPPSSQHQRQVYDAMMQMHQQHQQQVPHPSQYYQYQAALESLTRNSQYPGPSSSMMDGTP